MPTSSSPDLEPNPAISGGGGAVGCQREPGAVALGRAGGEEFAPGRGGPDGRAPRPNGRARRTVPPKLYRIGELVDYCGVSRQTIHNYTTMGLLRETRWTRGGHRLYDESVFHRLDAIAELKDRRKSLEEIREHFERLDGQ